MSHVALVRCGIYEEAEVTAALNRALELTGGLEDIIKPGMRVMVKVNLLTAALPDRCVTPHPAVVEAVVRRAQALGASVTIADSPGGPFAAAYLNKVYHDTGMAEVAERTGAALNRDVTVQVVPFEEGAAIKHIDLIGALNSADAVINCAKLKTHTFMDMSCAVKNLFGCVPGMRKTEYHARFSDKPAFGRMLNDIALCVKPVLNIVDAVQGMEGEGPAFGSPRQVGALVAGRSPFTVDVVCAQLMNMDEARIATLGDARARGLIPAFEVLGEAVDALCVKDYKGPSTAHSGRLQRLAGVLRPSPDFNAFKCVRCGVCVRACPKEALTMGAHAPVLTKKRCIRCFCCQELCPKGAVDVRHAPLANLLTLGARFKRVKPAGEGTGSGEE